MLPSCKSPTKIGRLTSILILAVLFFCVLPDSVARSADRCLSATGEEAVVACRRALVNDPGNVDLRFALSDAYMSLKRYEAAVAVLREGFEHAPGDDRIKRKLMLAESYLDEQRWIEKQQASRNAATGTKKMQTQLRLSLIRCQKLKGDEAVAACNRGLAVDPSNPELLTGRGSARLDMGRFGDAIADFESALASDPNNRAATKNLRLAHARRKVKVAQCFNGDGPNALAACDAALMQGASDAFAIQKKRAELLHAMDREKDAIKAYRAAARLNPADSQVASALAALRPADNTPAVRPSDKRPPVASSNAEPSPAAPSAPVKPRPPTEPPAPAPPPLKATAVKPKQPAATVFASAATATKIVKPTPSPIEPLSATEVPALQVRRFSNLPEVPGITH